MDYQLIQQKRAKKSDVELLWMPGWLLDMIKQASFSGALSCSSSWASERGAAKSSAAGVEKKQKSQLVQISPDFLVWGQIF